MDTIENKDKDEKGRFKKGNSCSPGRGNSKAAWRKELLKACEEEFTADKIIEILRAMHLRAVKYGDMKAAKLYLERSLGKVKEEIDIDVTTDGEKISFTFIPSGKKSIKEE